MATVTATWSTPQIEGSNRTNIFKRLLRETGLGVTGTATGGTTTTIVDTTRLKSTQYDSKEWVGGWARISRDAGGAAAAPEGEISAITTYDPSTGTIAFNPAMTQAPASGDFYELWRNPDPSNAKDILDEILQEELYFPCWTILTEVPDGDMEQSSASADWTAGGATVTKATAEPSAYGKRYLSVVSVSALDYARTISINAQPSKRYHVSALARGNATLVVRDMTNNANIDSKASTQQYWNRIWFEFTTPATCLQFQIRLSCTNAGETTYWDEVCMYPLDATDIRLPWWVKQKNQKLGIYRLNPTVIDNNIWDANLQGEEDQAWEVQDRFGGGGQLRAQARYGDMSKGPLFFYGLRNETAYANDNTDIKFVDQNLTVALLAFKVYDYLAHMPISGQLGKDWIAAERNKFERRYRMLEYQQMENNQRSRSAPEPLVAVNDSLSRFHYGR